MARHAARAAALFEQYSNMKPAASRKLRNFMESLAQQTSERPLHQPQAYSFRKRTCPPSRRGGTSALSKQGGGPWG